MSKTVVTESPLIPLEIPLGRSERPVLIALAGNPNSGKTTLFNVLTRGNAKVGNYPGITVDRRSGPTSLEGLGRVEIVDIPGMYSLNARSADERLALDELLGLSGNPVPDLIVLTVDALALERSLYLVMQVIEFGLNLVVAVNMMDTAVAEGIRIDFKQLTELFGVPFVPIVARQGEGVDFLKRAIAREVQSERSQTRKWLWDPNSGLAEDLKNLQAKVAETVPSLRSKAPQLAYALWLLMSVDEQEETRTIPASLYEEVVKLKGAIEAAGRDLDDEAVLPRYRFIDEHARAFIERPGQRAPTTTERIDSVLTHPVWGTVVFLAIMLLIFQSLFTWSIPFMDMIEGLFNWVGEAVGALLDEGLIREVVTDGIIPGVSAVVVFLPQILFLFLFLTILEGTGYLARTAFLTDRILNRIGLHGKAFVPMISGFACAVPAVMAVRTIENRRDRLLTIMVIPLMSCSARLPVYTLIIAALFPAQLKVGFLSVGSLMLLAIYFVSTISALVAAAVLGKIVFKGDRQPMLIELPPYRIPKWKTVARALSERARDFLKTAGRIILVASVVIWALLTFPRVTVPEPVSSQRDALSMENSVGSVDPDAANRSEIMKHSFAGRFGKVIEPVIAPLGFDWKIGIGLLGAFAAREVFVSTMGVVYGLGEDTDELSEGLQDAIRQDQRADGSKLWTPLTGMSLLVFFMFSLQCMSTVAVVKRETRSWKWTLFLIGYMSVLAYTASLLVYQGGHLLGFE